MNKNTLFLLAALFISFFLVFMPAYDELDRLRSACIRLEKKIRELALSAAALSAFGINNPETWLYKNESEILDLIRPLQKEYRLFLAAEELSDQEYRAEFRGTQNGVFSLVDSLLRQKKALQIKEMIIEQADPVKCLIIISYRKQERL